jgi:hypothetical protein
MKTDATIAKLSAWLSTCSLRPEHSSSLASALLDIKKDAGFDELKETLLHGRGTVDQALRAIKWSAAGTQGRDTICGTASDLSVLTNDADALIVEILHSAGPKIDVFPDSLQAQLESAYVSARHSASASAVTTLQDAAGKQYHLAEAYLALLYEQGCPGLKKNSNLAREYIRRALPWLQTETARGNKYAQS